MVDEVSGPLKNLNIGIFSETINAINVKVYMMVLLIELDAKMTPITRKLV